MVLLSLAALILSVACLRLAWGQNIRPSLGLLGSLVLLVAGIVALIPVLGEGRATMAVLAAVLPCGAGFVLIGRETRQGRGQAAITRHPDGPRTRLHLVRWTLAGPVAGALAFGLALALGFLPGMVIESRIAIVFCLWPVFWAGLGMAALSADRLRTAPYSSVARLMDYRAFVRQALAGHGLIGVVLGALVFQICLTGALSVLSGELRMLEQPAAPIVRAAPPEAFEALVHHGYAQARGTGDAIIILGPTEQYPRLELRQSGVADGYADASGAIVAAANTPWTDFVTELHENLHIPGVWGSALMGLAGVALLGSLISGVAAHARIWRDLFRLRLRGSDRKREADLHNRMGVWGIPAYLVIAFTGAYLSFAPMLGSMIAPIFADERPQGAVSAPAVEVGTEQITVPPVAELIRQLESEHAPAKVSFVMLTAPGTAGQTLYLDTDLPGQLASGESYRFDAQGKSLGPEGYADGPVGLQLGVAMFPLHFGNFAGPLMRWLYFTIGLALCYLVATGMRIWLIRMRQQGTRVAARWRLWTIFLWGQPLALALAWIGAAAGLHPMPVYVATTLLGLALSGLRFSNAALRQGLKLATTGALFGILILVTLRIGGHPFERSASWLVLVAAFAFAAAARTGAARAAQRDALILGEQT
jgi:uncharacterized iron-regulated membrane protein